MAAEMHDGRFSLSPPDASVSRSCCCPGVMIRIIPVKGLIVVFLALLAPISLSAQEQRPHSILVLDQSDGGPFYYQLISGLRGVVAAHADAHVTLYSENLDLSRFSGQAFEESLKSHLKEKYQGKSIGAIVSVGAATTEMALKWHDELWPGIPLVFAMLDEMDVARIKPPVDVTGVVVHLPLADAIKVARAVVPDLDTVALVGDAWDGLVVYRNWGGEIGSAAAGLKVIEIIGQKLSDIRERVAGLPERSAIIYSAVFSDGEGKFYLPSVALRHIAEKANRPIVVPAETFLANGGIGGYVLILVRHWHGNGKTRAEGSGRRACSGHSAGVRRCQTALQLGTDATMECQRVQTPRRQRDPFPRAGLHGEVSLAEHGGRRGAVDPGGVDPVPAA